MSAAEQTAWRSSTFLRSDEPFVFNETQDEHFEYSKASWAIEVVDSTGIVGSWNSLALDNENNPHISYYDTTNRDLKYAVWTSCGWEIEAIDTLDDVGEYSSLSLDSGGNAHIGYYDATNSDLKYAHQISADWISETVDSLGDIGRATSLALDGYGNVHISYYDTTNGDLKHAYQTNGSWTSESVDSSGNVGNFTSLEIDGEGNAHIGYYDATNSDLKYAYWTGSSWSIETVDSQGDQVGWVPAIAIDSEGYAHISYLHIDLIENSLIPYLRYAKQEGSSWLVETVDVGGIWGGNTSIAVDTTDNPHIAYIDDRTGYAKYAYWTGSNWVIETVQESDVYQPSLAIDSEGYALISFQHGFIRDEDELRLARRAEVMFKKTEVMFENVVYLPLVVTTRALC